MPSISLARRRPTGLSVTTRIAVSTVVLTILASTVASAQTAETIREFGLFPTIGLRLVGGIVGNFVAGGLLVALAPKFARERVRAIRDDPGSAFVWGLLTGIGVPILLALAAVTIIGLLIAIPGYLCNYSTDTVVEGHRAGPDRRQSNRTVTYSDRSAAGTLCEMASSIVPKPAVCRDCDIP